MAHAREKFCLGAAFEQGDLTLLPRGFGIARIGDIPVDADAPDDVALFIAHRPPLGGQPAHLAIGPDNAKFMLAAGNLFHRIVQPLLDGVAVIGVHKFQPLLR